ncbi:MAG: arsenate reductase ArsC [Anaerolineales bacterium]|nr:arsenate reductase ArsC [Anaerolineales bacterium]
MAEAIVNDRLLSRWEAHSAGIRPAAAVHPFVARVLAESGISFKGSPKGPEAVQGTAFDLVITLCDSARQECPVWLGSGGRAHHDYADPSLVQGPEEERIDAFRKLRDEMLAELPYLLERHGDRKLE